MSDTVQPTCAAIEAMAPELATGTLAGGERASALVHLETCTRCRQLVDELAAMADELLLLSPEAEPPLGFESRTASRIARVAAGTPSIAAARSRRRPRRVALVAAAAFLVGALSAGGAAFWIGGRGGSPAPVASGPVRMAVVNAAGGRYTCHAVAVGAGPTWIYMALDQPVAHDIEYRVEAVTSAGPAKPVGTVVVHDGHGSMGVKVDVASADLTSLRVLDTSGIVRYEARFGPAGQQPTGSAAPAVTDIMYG